MTIAALVLTAPLYISFLILFDAFRRFRSLKSQEKVINNVKVGALSFAFFAYALGITAALLLSLKDNITNENTGSEKPVGVYVSTQVIDFAYCVSDLVLAIVLFELILSQFSQMGSSDSDEI